MRHANILFKALFVALLAVGMTGCDMLEDTFGNEKEAEGIVEAVGDAFFTMDGIDYAVTSSTEWEGSLSGLSDLSVGDEIEVEYKEESGGRTAEEVELKADDDD